MARIVHTASAQMGPIAKSETRKDTVGRLIAMMREAKGRGADLVVFTELGAHHLLSALADRGRSRARQLLRDAKCRGRRRSRCSTRRRSSASASIWAMPSWSARTAASAASTPRSWSIARATIVGKYRKVHLPGHAEPQPGRTHQHLEKRYFEPGNLGFRVWRAFGGVMGMCICNDRRWPETYRVMGLQGVEMVMLGYNTPYDHTGHRDIDSLTQFHNHLSMQAGAYQNSTWVIGTAKCGVEEGSKMVGQSAIIAPVRRDRRAGRVARGRGDHRALRSRPRQALSRDDLQFRQAPRAGRLPADRRAQGRGAAAGVMTELPSPD